MTDSRRVLLCPNCGAPLPPAATHETVVCAFCKVSSAISEIADATEAKHSDHACPRCTTKLFFGETDGIALGCGLCGGIWLDNASAQRVMARYDGAVAELASRATASATKRPDVRAPVNCAECGASMQRKRVGDVEIDLCLAHGTWFDAGELGRVIDPLRPVQMVPATFEEDSAPNFASSSSSTDWGDVAGTVAVGAFEILAAVLTD